ncbi:MAG: GAF domain-containing sensor histidine kinase [Ardenticatenaceae bacterium]|nr:GAF domain-containing sensor histidine kinase [Ardenticatenaceae bacterium]
MHNPLSQIDFRLSSKSVLPKIIWLVVVAQSAVFILLGIFTRYDSLTKLVLPNAITDMRLSSADLAALTALGVSKNFYIWFIVLNELIFALGFISIGIFIYSRKTDDWLAWCVSLALIAFGVTGGGLADFAVPADSSWFWVMEMIQAIGTAGMVSLFFIFPNGRFVPTWSKWLVQGWCLLVFFWFLFPSVPLNMLDGEVWGQTPLASTIFALILFNIGVFSQFYRYIKVSDFVAKQQTKWIVMGFAATATAGTIFYLPPLLSEELATSGSLRMSRNLFILPLANLLVLALPASIAIAIFRYRLWDIDILINRTLVYTSLTTIIVAAYILLVGSLNALFQAQNNLWVSLVATAFVTVIFQPLRENLQRWVNRLMFGERDDPVRMLRHLGERLKFSLHPDETLPTLVATIGETLKLSFVAISFAHGDGWFEVVATYGKPLEKKHYFPLIYQTETIGRLTVSPRSPQEPLSAADLQLLENVSLQAGAAVHAVQLYADLQASRRHLISAREEERRRLRRDLHDGVGPSLASHVLKIGSVRKLLQRKPEDVDVLLDSLESDVKRTLEELRVVINNLRPSTLDQLGLLGALEEWVLNTRQSSDLEIHLDVSQPLPDLPAAVEVAAYRIALEALNNVLKHAKASKCVVHIEVNRHFHLTVTDNGNGLSPSSFGRRKGVGLGSMRARANELGGNCYIQSLGTGGTQVQAILPIENDFSDG